MRARPRARGRARLLLLLALVLLAAPHAHAQAGGGHTLYGDVKVDESKAQGMKPLTFDVILYYLDGRVVSRQRVAGGGRYRFNGLKAGEYDLVVEVDSTEVARLRVALGGGPPSDFRQDVEMEWKTTPAGDAPARKQTVSAADFYPRPPAAQSSFEKAQEALDKKRYEQAVALLRRLLDADGGDFQAWTELGTAYMLQDRKDEAEKAYRRAVEARPTFALALLDLGRLRASQKRFDEAVEPLSRAVEAEPSNAEANLLLGESYLQLKKGSKAVPYLEEAARLGRPDAHLRLATLYNAVGLKDRAADQYEQYLAAKPDSPDRKKLEEYIKENKKK